MIADIKAFWADLDHASIPIPYAHDALDDRERARAKRFVADRDRVRFVQRRFLLRRVLSGYLRCDPADVRYRTGPQGKLFLAHPGPHFNASHSHGLALLAVAPAVPVGCDVERLDDAIDIDRTAEQLFACGERHQIRQASSSERQRIFFQYWTRKEAYVKATGAGLLQPLASFDLSSSMVPGWSFASFAPLAGFCAAIAAPTASINLVTHRIEDELC